MIKSPILTANIFSAILHCRISVDEVPGKSPRFVFNATNVQSGVLWRFMKPYMGDYRVGLIEKPLIPLAVAVAASPPLSRRFFHRSNLISTAEDFKENSGTDLKADEFRTQIVLTDGGVYDNLGLETAWKRYTTILISDAGGGFAAEADPHRDWVRHSVRVLLPSTIRSGALGNARRSKRSNREQKRNLLGIRANVTRKIIRLPSR